MLRSSIAEIGVHTTDALVAGNNELAERLESERQTVRIVISTIDTVVNRLLQDELTVATSGQKCNPIRPDLRDPTIFATPNLSTPLDE